MKARLKPFDRTFDVARFHRVTDKSASPILYARANVDRKKIKLTAISLN